MTILDDSPADLAARILTDGAAATERPPTAVLPDDLLGGPSRGVALLTVLRTNGFALLATLSVVYLIDQLGVAAFSILGPDIQRSLHLTDTALGAVNSAGSLTFVVAAVPLGFIADRTRRTWLAGGCAVLAALFGCVIGAASSLWVLIAGKLGTGVGQSSILPVHNSLLADGYPADGRTRVLAVHNLAYGTAALGGPFLAGAIAALAGGGHSAWRWTFIVLAVPGLIAGLVLFRTREPERGANEAVLPDVAPLPISFSAASERLLKIRTLRYLLVGIGVFGFTLAGVPTFFNVLLQRHYHLVAFDRGLIGSFTQAGGLLGVPVGGVLGDRLFRRSPPRAIVLVAASLGIYGLVLPLALRLPGLVPVVVGVGLANVCVSAATVPVYSFVAAVSPYRLRALAFALIGVYIFLMGGFLGGILTGAFSDSFGPRTALTIVVPPAALIAAALVAWGARHVRRDLSDMIRELDGEREEIARVAAGDEVSLLQVSDLDVSYGPVQVLFGVNLDVRRGEVLALLGTNGAGKSTLLRAISGLVTPDRGVVRLQGRTVSYVDAEARVGLGIVQVPGGKAIFGSLTVGENLRVGAHRFIWDLDRVTDRIEHVLELFPVLRDRLDQTASTLSGGEQQMLALAKALLLEPTILLIDELSLGLAPIVIAELLSIVERLKADGMTIVIVEQSLNVALELADRAVFMEKGEIRFEGPARELARRDDLVRAVFLGGGRDGAPAGTM